VWSHRAKLRLFYIMEFYTNRNRSKAYSTKLYRTFNRELRLLLKHPNIGILTDEPDVRGLIVGDFVLYYETDDWHIIVHTVWDCRQNPDSLVIK
jgi:plasmid stabilization system protein ParE